MNQIEEETGGAIVKIVIGNKSPPYIIIISKIVQGNR